jgi:2-dehydropantoate 2-reductase
MTKKIAVLGTGANGSCIAADLIDAGHDVTLIDQWPAHIEAMRADGLRIEMGDDVQHVPVRAYHLCDVCTFDEKFDVVLLAMKAYDAVWASHLIEPYLQPDGLLVGTQNGMMAEAIASVVGPSRTLGCAYDVSSQISTPGVVQRTLGHENCWFGLGSLDPSTAGREEEVAELLRHVGRVEVVPDILSTKWTKLTFNAMELTSASILGLSNTDALEFPGMRALMLRLGAEAVEAGELLGYQTAPILGLGAEDVADRETFPEVLLDAYSAMLSTKTPNPDTRNTVLMDYDKGRKTETASINGRVAYELERVGKSGAANAAIAEISERITKGELEPVITNFDLVQEMLAME